MKRKKYYWEDFPIGSVTEYGGVTLSKEDIVRFAKEFDPQPFHIDEEAAKHSQFGGLIASGWHTCSLCMRMMCDAYLLESANLASPGVENIRWLKPVRPGDTIFVEVEVTSTRLSSKGDRGYVGVSYTVKNQKGDAVLTMTGTQLLALRPSREPRPKTKTAETR